MSGVLRVCARVCVCVCVEFLDLKLVKMCGPQHEGYNPPLTRRKRRQLKKDALEHRSHFGSRYKLGCCGHAGLFSYIRSSRFQPFVFFLGTITKIVSAFAVTEINAFATPEHIPHSMN